MVRHCVALLVVTVAGWLSVLEVLKWRDVHCCFPDEHVGGVPWPILAASIVAAVLAVALVAPRKRSRESLRERMGMVAPAFLPLPLVILAVVVSDSPGQNGKELLGEIERKTRTGQPFTIGELVRESYGTVWVFRGDASAEHVTGELGVSWNEAAEVADRSERRRLWVLTDQTGEVRLWFRAPEALDACLAPGAHKLPARLDCPRP